LEKVTVLSSTLATKRQKVQRRLGISSKPKTETDFIWTLAIFERGIG
jgi:hypothetical protein